MAHLAVLLLALLAVTSCSREPASQPAVGADEPVTRLPRSGPAADLRFMTGARTRVVWVQGDGTDPYATGDNLMLMGFDTDDAAGERAIVRERGSFVKPMLTPRGDRVVYTSRLTAPEGPTMFIVNWDGTGLRELGKGWALTLWEEPGTGREWIYIGTGATPERPYDSTAVSRAPLDDLDTRTPVWDKGLVGGDTFQVSADGRLAGGMFPWPHAAIAELPNGTLRKLGEGCWPALATPGVPVFWYFDGAHRNVTMVDTSAERRWTVPVNGAPGFDNAEVYHPRWTNHPRFLAISGPYNQGGANQVRSGGTQSEIYVGRFDERYTRVESWVRVTDNGAGDSYPDVWIDRERSDVPIRASQPIGPDDGDATRVTGEAGARGGASADRLVVRARLANAGPIPSPRAIAPYRNALVVNAYEVVDVLEGTYEPSQILVAQWAIQDARVLPGAQRAVGSVARLTLERYDARPELEGERLIAQSGGPDLPIYYDLGSRP